MEGLWIFAALVVCPLTMGLMMFFMMRGKRGDERAADERRAPRLRRGPPGPRLRLSRAGRASARPTFTAAKQDDTNDED